MSETRTGMKTLQQAVKTQWRTEMMINHCQALEKSRGKITLEVIQDAANSIFPWIQLILDTPEMHDTGMVPVLDLQVWVRRPQDDTDGLESSLLAYLFYEKPTAADKVMRASSAFTWRQKLVTMGMEIYRRMRNSCRQITLSARCDLIEKFVHKMRSSGYPMSAVKGMITSGVDYYYRKLKIDLQGRPRLNTKDDTNEMTKRREKLTSSQMWFSRRRGGTAERMKKDLGWMQRQVTKTGGQGVAAACPPVPHAPPPPNPCTTQQATGGEHVSNIRKEQKTISTLLVPYTMGSKLHQEIQTAEDDFCKLTGCDRVRVVEKGGDVLINLVGRNDPWASRRCCTDKACPTCSSRRQLSEMTKRAKKEGEG